MTLPELSIKNPVFAVMLSAAMVVFGALGYKQMGVSQFPEIDFPVVSVAITLEQASPEVMDGDVTDIVEDAVSGVEGVDYVMSQSMQGLSVVTVFFRLERKIDAAMQDVQNAVAASRRKLPREIDPPVIAKVNPNFLPVAWITLSSGTVPPNQISDFAERELKPRLAQLPDFGGVQFSGLRTRNIRVWLDSNKLEAFNLSASDVQAAIQKQHVEMPAGYVNSSLIEMNVRTMGEAYSIPEFGRILVAQRNSQSIYLSDVASNIQDGSEDERTLARYNRLPTVAVGVRKAIGGNLVTICEGVKRELPNIRRSLPKGVELAMPVDYSVFVRENIEEMRLTLLLGVLLTAVICFLFLGSIGTTFNICLSIPTSLIGTFFFIQYGPELLGMAPFTINMMTLLALSLSVGVVVDDAILVLENIHRHREMGKSKAEAAREGTREISFAAIAATMSIMAIFLPVAFMSGTIGRFFFQFGVTVGVAVFLSLICALTLTPMLCSFFISTGHREPVRFRPGRLAWGILGLLFVPAVFSLLRVMKLGSEWDWIAWPAKGFETPEPDMRREAWIRSLYVEAGTGFLLGLFGGLFYQLFNNFVLYPLLIWPTNTLMNAMTRGYAFTLRLAISAWPVTAGAAVVLIGVSAYMLAYDVLGTELIPSEDQSRFVVHIVCPVASNLNQVNEMLQECEQVLVNRPDVAGFLTSVGNESGQLIYEADIFVNLRPRTERELPQKKIMAEVRRDLEEIKDIRVVIRDQSLEGFTAQRGDPIDFALLGRWEELPGLATRIMERMRDSGLMVDIDCDYRPGKTEEQVFPDRDKLAMLNIPINRVADSMGLLVGGQRVAKFTDRGRRYDVRLRLVEGQRSTPGSIDPLTIRAGDDRLVPLSDVVHRQTVATLPVINRFKHQRKIEVTASPAPGVSQGEAIARANQIAAEVMAEFAGDHNPMEKVELGNAQAMNDTIRSLVFALILGIVIAYMILAVQFNSFVHPFTVLMALPFAVTGALVTLWLTGDTLNMMSMIGLILLMGLVKKNSIILVDYTNQVRKDMPDVREAVLKACPVRLRPIVMTSLATMMAALPAAVGVGPGAETRAPMARGIIGGILLSTLVTLYLVPVFYIGMEKLREWLRKALIS